MHILETYALASGSKIDKPFIYTKYAPLPFDNYITVQSCGKAQSRQYEYWQEVIDFIKPALDEMGIAIVQVGSKEEPALVGVLPLNGQTDLGQLSYVISRSRLHLGVDSCGIHIASAFDIPMVAIYGNSDPRCCGPFFGNKEKQSIITPFDFEKVYPSYADAEPKKAIDTLKPEKIASEVLKLLGADLRFEIIHKTALRGPNYTHGNIQCIPDAVTSFKDSGVNNMIMRMDLVFDQDILVNQLSKSKCSIITRKPILPDILEKFRSNITEVIYILDETHDPSFVETLKSFGINFVLLAEMQEEQIQAIKMYYMEYGLIQQKKAPSPQDIDSLKQHGVENLFYRSKKFFISKGKIFPSIAAWEENKPIEDAKVRTLPVIDKESFWREIEDYYLLKKIA